MVRGCRTKEGDTRVSLHGICISGGPFLTGLLIASRGWKIGITSELLACGGLVDFDRPFRCCRRTHEVELGSGSLMQDLGTTPFQGLTALEFLIGTGASGEALSAEAQGASRVSRSTYVNRPSSVRSRTPLSSSSSSLLTLNFSNAGELWGVLLCPAPSRVGLPECASGVSGTKN